MRIYHILENQHSIQLPFPDRCKSNLILQVFGEKIWENGLSWWLDITSYLKSSGWWKTLLVSVVGTFQFIDNKRSSCLGWTHYAQKPQFSQTWDFIAEDRAQVDISIKEKRNPSLRHLWHCSYIQTYNCPSKDGSASGSHFASRCALSKVWFWVSLTRIFSMSLEKC